MLTSTPRLKPSMALHCPQYEVRVPSLASRGRVPRKKFPPRRPVSPSPLTSGIAHSARFPGNLSSVVLRQRGKGGLSLGFPIKHTGPG